jgi:hypothetical protein
MFRITGETIYGSKNHALITYSESIMLKRIRLTNLTKITKLTMHGLIATALTGIAFQAIAEDKMKPGLWEMKIRSDAVKSMPVIPQAQLDELKKRGIKMPEMQDGAIIQKICVTKEMAERTAKAPMQNNPGGCKEKNAVKNSNSFSMELVCDSPMLKGTGMVKGSFSSDNLQTTYDFTGTSNNRPTVQHVETNGKWLGVDCGDVKPIQVPAANTAPVKK